MLLSQQHHRLSNNVSSSLVSPPKRATLAGRSRRRGARIRKATGLIVAIKRITSALTLIRSLMVTYSFSSSSHIMTTMKWQEDTTKASFTSLGSIMEVVMVTIITIHKRRITATTTTLLIRNNRMPSHQLLTRRHQRRRIPRLRTRLPRQQQHWCSLPRRRTSTWSAMALQAVAIRWPQHLTRSNSTRRSSLKRRRLTGKIKCHRPLSRCERIYLSSSTSKSQAWALTSKSKIFEVKSILYFEFVTLN